MFNEPSSSCNPWCPLDQCFIPYLVPILDQSGKFMVKSLICIEQFGAMFSTINLKGVKIDRLLPLDVDSMGEDIKQLPKL